MKSNKGPFPFIIMALVCFVICLLTSILAYYMLFIHEDPVLVKINESITEITLLENQTEEYEHIYTEILAGLPKQDNKKLLNQIDKHLSNLRKLSPFWASDISFQYLHNLIRNSGILRENLNKYSGKFTKEHFRKNIHPTIKMFHISLYNIENSIIPLKENIESRLAFRRKSVQAVQLTISFTGFLTVLYLLFAFLRLRARFYENL